MRIELWNSGKISRNFTKKNNNICFRFVSQQGIKQQRIKNNEFIIIETVIMN